MDTAITNIVVVGGGTAGWLAACRIAAAAVSNRPSPVTVTLIESPEAPTIGVGEGTWPTMRHTLKQIGISEADFLLACDASFKQGSRFIGWASGGESDVYFHPFTPPAEAVASDLVDAWQTQRPVKAFADTVTPQSRVAHLNLSPRQRKMPDYSGALNYAYHLDAVKLAALLARHGTERLGIRHLGDHVVDGERHENGDLAALRTRNSGIVEGDLFIDCTGHAALLIGAQLGVPFIDRGDVLFNDRALAVQVPSAPDAPIASQTDATAHRAGWIWDIGLPTRRGVGCVYSSRFMDDDAATEMLMAYLARTEPSLDARSLSPRRLAFRSGYRERYWVNNCLAIGLAGGFLEPLEASAIVMIELSVNALLDGFPATRAAMDIHAARFNELFRYRWERIVEFLKLHYALSERDEPYWKSHREPETVPSRLEQLLTLWRDQPPSRYDFPQMDEIFPAASYQYVLYGMGFPPPVRGPIRPAGDTNLAASLAQIEQRGRALASSLPTNRAYLSALASERPPVRMERIS